MSTLHPIMAAALAPFVPPSRNTPIDLVDQLIKDIAVHNISAERTISTLHTLKAAMPPARIITAGQHKQDNAQLDKVNLKGLFEYEYTVEDLTIQCFLEFEAAERDSFDCPGHSANITLIHALVNGVDVACLLDDNTVAEIEDEAVGNMESLADDEEYDRGQDIYESRRSA